MTIDPEDEISVTEAAALLGVSRPTIFYLLGLGPKAAALGSRRPQKKLDSRKVGHQHILSRRQVLAYRASRVGKGKPGPVPGAGRSPMAADPGLDEPPGPA